MTTPQGMLELADRIKNAERNWLSGIGTVVSLILDEDQAIKIEATLRQAAAPQGREAIAQIIEEHCVCDDQDCMYVLSLKAADAILALPALAGEGREALEADCLASVVAALKSTEEDDINFFLGLRAMSPEQRWDNVRSFRSQIINVAAGEMFTRLTPAVAPDKLRQEAYRELGPNQCPVCAALSHNGTRKER